MFDCLDVSEGGVEVERLLLCESLMGCVLVNGLEDVWKASEVVNPASHVSVS